MMQKDTAIAPVPDPAPAATMPPIFAKSLATTTIARGASKTPVRPVAWVAQRCCALLVPLLIALQPAAASPPELAPIPAARPDEVPPPPPATQQLMRAARLTGITGWLVRDLDSGAVIDAYRENQPFVPASVAKLPTAAYALDVLGAGYRFETRLLAQGTLSGTTLEGDLVLAGGGDPEFDTDALVSLAEMAAGRLGRVTGRLIADPGPMARLEAIEPNQPPDAAYNPGVAGLSLNFNRVRVEWPRGGQPISVRAQALVNRPETDAVTVTPVPRLARPMIPRREAVARGLVAGPATAPGEQAEAWLINERALRRAGGRWLPVRDPVRYSARVLDDVLEDKGIALAGGIAVQPGAAHRPREGVIARVEGRPLERVLQAMLRHSTNLTAEMVGLAASGERRGEGLVAATAPGSLRSVARASGGGITMTLGGGETDPAGLAISAAAMNDWAAAKAGFAPGAAGFRLANHSGLSLASRVSPARMVDLLAALDPVDAGAERALWLQERRRGAPGVAALLRPHNVAFEDDGLDHAKLRVVAKTGTMTFVRGLAGYVATPEGRRLAFAVFCNDVPRRETNRRGSRSWTARARNLERHLIGEWVRMADAEVERPNATLLAR
ncbi:MAG: D-alanyl-D-alanine carboxypeptidase [Pseudomonadota bacterium]